LASVGYAVDEHRLEIEFRNGKVYEYRLVPPSIFRELMAAPSKGGFVNRAIKDVFPARPL